MQDKINSIKLKNGFFIWSTVNKSQNKGSNPTRMKEYIHTHIYASMHVQFFADYTINSKMKSANNL